MTTQAIATAVEQDNWRARAIDTALNQLEAGLVQFTLTFPGENSFGGHYRPMRFGAFADGRNVSWTTGLWTGQLWLAYELSDRAVFRAGAEAQLPSYAERLAERNDLATHDLGFIYTPSCVTAWRLTGNQAAGDCALQAANELMTRYLPKAGVIQAWGDLNDPTLRGRMIIDCLMNLPLLYWASEMTGDAVYRQAAETHVLRAQQVLVRPDASTYHTYHFDPVSGDPLRGTTHQGFSDTSCWSRGQAWGIYGFALNHRYAPGLGLLDTALRLADYFLEHLPANGVAYWDLCFGEGSDEPWDSSASAIAVCGLFELCEQLPEGEQRSHYHRAALRILHGLVSTCAGRQPDATGLLLHGVYHKPEAMGVDEANQWGDYFYLEALARAGGPWTTHW